MWNWDFFIYYRWREVSVDWKAQKHCCVLCPRNTSSHPFATRSCVAGKVCYQVTHKLSKYQNNKDQPSVFHASDISQSIAAHAVAFCVLKKVTEPRRISSASSNQRPKDNSPLHYGLSYKAHSECECDSLKKTKRKRIAAFVCKKSQV